ncbi:hypothetical protein V1527DRAFT_475579 [Lipomyces starkeyi]
MKVPLSKIGYFHMETFLKKKWQRHSTNGINDTCDLLFMTSGFSVDVDYGSVSLIINYKGIWSLLDFFQELVTAEGVLAETAGSRRQLL